MKFFSFLSAKTALISALALFTAGTVHATPMLLNGSFETSTGPGYINGSQTLANWTNNNGYSFLFNSATGQAGSGGLSLWGPANGTANGLGASPDGGNYVGLDGDYGQNLLYQLVTGLTPGKSVDVSFWYAGAQQYGFNGASTDALQVYFGSTSNYTSAMTPVLQNASHGFTGWQHQTFSFIANDTSDYLAFLAVGTPEGVPPFSLLDGVSVADTPLTPNVAATPEPSSLLLVATGMMGAAGIVRRKYLTKTVIA